MLDKSTKTVAKEVLAQSACEENLPTTCVAAATALWWCWCWCWRWRWCWLLLRLTRCECNCRRCLWCCSAPACNQLKLELKTAKTTTQIMHGQRLDKYVGMYVCVRTCVSVCAHTYRHTYIFHKNFVKIKNIFAIA